MSNYVMHAVGRIGSTVEMFVHDCNAFYVTLSQSEVRTSFPLPIVDLSFDNEKNRLALEIRPA